PMPDITVVTDEADNCSSSPVVAFVEDISDGNSNPEVITRIYSVTDAAGNSINVSQTITINDTTFPTASNPSSISAQCSAPMPDITVVTDEADNCSTPNVAFVSDVITSPGIITRTYSVTDAAENSINVTQTITLNDNILPTASNLPPINAQCSAPAPDITIITDHTDNCGTPTIAFVNDVSDGNSNPEVITRTYSVTDAAGNSINVTQIITINDGTDPNINCPANITQNADANSTFATVVYSDPIVNDNCGVNSIVQLTGLPSGAEFPIGTTINTFVLTDNAGNTSQCSFEVTVIDNPLPTCTIDAGEDERITEGEEIQLDATASTTGSFVWSPSIGLSDTTTSNPIASPSITTTYLVEFTSEDGCVAVDEVIVFVTPQEEDETRYGFSPDGDGINEFWEIDTIENYPNNSVSIFNRWGDLVFEIEGYNNTSRVFRGIANRKRSLGGDQLPEGTYFFKIRTSGPNSLRKTEGFLVLKR
ncbi:gliding motility-associated C-terminal domain-containing protein, partial [Aquimarina spongiae]